MVNGTSSPKLFAMAIAMAVLPVPGWPPINMALPAILPYLIISRMIPAALLASTWIKMTNYLTDHTHGSFSRVQGFIDTETSDVGMSAYSFDSGYVFHLWDFGLGSLHLFKII